MWYVMQVTTGSEEKTKKICRLLIDKESVEDFFIPYYEENRKVQGVWTIRKRILFPGYLFFISDNIEAVLEKLKNIYVQTNILKTGDDITHLSDEDKAFLLSIGNQERLVKMSEGIIEGDKITVLRGPLMGREGLIKKIDRHKRLAWIEVNMFNRHQRVKVGLEIVKKS